MSEPLPARIAEAKACPNCGVERYESPCQRCGVTWDPQPWQGVMAQMRARMTGYEIWRDVVTERHEEGDGIWEFYSQKTWNSLLHWKDRFEKSESQLARAHAVIEAAREAVDDAHVPARSLDGEACDSPPFCPGCNLGRALTDFDHHTLPRPESEMVCDRCNQRHGVVWFAPSDVWNATMRDGDRGNPDRYGFCCPNCFAQLADETIGPYSWLILPFTDGPVDRADQIRLMRDALADFDRGEQG